MAKSHVAIFRGFSHHALCRINNACLGILHEDQPFPTCSISLYLEPSDRVSRRNDGMLYECHWDESIATFDLRAVLLLHFRASPKMIYSRLKLVLSLSRLKRLPYPGTASPATQSFVERHVLALSFCAHRQQPYTSSTGTSLHSSGIIISSPLGFTTL